ncbi:DUF4189 domain-containing protein [Pandoraea pnomenusa]|uniref:DUF4189 domain-containing protein n=1 Tax=Pandoraea pnomenusa TaxID=93220 RepID=UPI00334213BC
MMKWCRFLPAICSLWLASVLALASAPGLAASAVAGVRTASGFRLIYVTNQTSMAKAKIAAMNRCRVQFASGSRGGRCEVLMAGNGPAYWAVVRASNGEVGVALGDTEAAAIQDAFVVCERGGQCSLDNAQVWIDNGQRPGQRLPPPQAAQAAQAQCKIPTGQIIRMQTRCDNGQCVRTYENGCTVRFQASRCFDKETNSYIWQPKACDDDG